MRVPIPKEHGTWAMLYGPMLIAIFSSGAIETKGALFFLTASALFFMRGPLENGIRLHILSIQDSSRQLYFGLWFAIYGIAALIPGAILIMHYRLFGLLWFVLLYFAAFVSHLAFGFYRKERGIFSELMAVIALTSSAAAMQYTLTGSIGWLLWILSALYFSSSVFYVKMRVCRQLKKPDARSITVTCFVYHAFLIVVLSALALYSFVPVLTLFAFVPVLIRTFAGVHDKGKLNLRRIGLAEVVYTIFFVGWISVFLAVFVQNV